MTDLTGAAQDALFAALSPIAALGGMPDGLGVYQHVPENTEPPWIVIGQISSEDASDKGEAIEIVTAEIAFAYRGSARAPLLAMMKAARDALQNQVIGADGAAFERPRWLRSEASPAIADGVTYVGLQIFEFYAQSV